MRYFAHIAYNGANYSGWQRQPNAPSIQEVLENRLSQLLKKDTSIHGCGRTDALVHASQYFFQFNVDNELEPSATVKILNKTLPGDIVVYDIFKVNDRQQVQFNATSRTYNYFIHFKPNPFLHQQSAFYDLDKLDFQKMKQGLEALKKYSDFSGLCKTPERHSTTQCDISEVTIFHNNDFSQLRIEITANRFLRGMIRMIVGKLLEIGKGKLNIEEFEKNIATKETPKFLNLAYPQGLYLSNISYPNLCIATKTDYWPVYQSCNWEKL